MTENPFAVLTAVVPPAILTNACSVLALGTANRIARVVDRWRLITGELSATTKGSPAYAARLTQIERLRTRSSLLLMALRVIYASLGAFAASALITVVGAALAYYDFVWLFRSAAVVALVAGVSAVGGLVTGCGLMVAETRLALKSVREDMENVLEGRPL